MPHNRAKIIAAGKNLRLVSDGRWEFVERKKASGVVCIVAVTRQRRLILVEQFRAPVGKRVIELPAGLAGDTVAFDVESLATAANRELLEETGYEAKAMIELGTFASSAGLTNETATFFAAKSLKKTTEGGGDDSEEIEIHEVDLDEIDKWLKKAAANDRLIDARVYTGLYLWQSAMRRSR